MKIVKFRRVPAIAATSLAALTIGLSACSDSATTSGSSSPAEQQTTSQASTPQGSAGATTPAGESSSGPGVKSPDPELSSKLLTGEVAGVTLQPLNEIPDMEKALAGADVQVEPADCAGTGISQPGAGAMATTAQTGTVSVLLSSDTSAASKYADYAQRCSSVSGTAAGSPLKTSITPQQIPDIDGVTDLFAAESVTETNASGRQISTKTYLLIGNVNGTTVVAQSMTGGQETSPDTAAEIFKAQAEKLRG